MDYDEAIECQRRTLDFFTTQKGIQLLIEIDANHREIKDARPYLPNIVQCMPWVLAKGECYYWHPRITEAVCSASANIPKHWTFSIEHFPAPSGFFWFGDAIRLVDSCSLEFISKMIEDGAPKVIKDNTFGALAWILYKQVDANTIKDRNLKFSASFMSQKIPVEPVSTITEATHVMYLQFSGLKNALGVPTGVLIPVDTTLIELGTTIGEACYYLEDEEGLWTKYKNPNSCSFGMNLFASCLAFLEQKILMSVRTSLSRASRRRVEKTINNVPLPLLNVVKLRSIVRHNINDDESKSIDWSCQWIVKGHWRDQWYPKIKRNQPKWIMPYVKGPEDKPFRGSERIFAVVR